MGRFARFGSSAVALVLAGGTVQAAEPAACALVEASRADPLLSVPFRTIDGRIYVEARVDGKGPFTFAVDTGASGMGRADASLVARLGLPVHGSGETSDGVATAKVDTVRFASLALGKMERRDLEVITRDYGSRMAADAKFDGIIGREFFADGLLAIDYPNRMLRFTRSAGLARGDAGVLAYERAFRVRVTIGDVAAEGNLDTGANVAFVLPKSLFERAGGGETQAAGAGQLMNTAVETGRATMAVRFVSAPPNCAISRCACRTNIPNCSSARTRSSISRC